MMLVAVAASVRAAALPPAVAAELRALTDQCRDVGGTPHADKAVTQVDLTGDGKGDYVLDVAAIDCEGAAAVYGDREKGVTVYVGDGSGGATKAFGDAVYGVKIEGGKVWLTVSGAQCGKPPAPDFAHESFCDRALVWNGTTRKLGYAPVSSVRMIQ